MKGKIDSLKKEEKRIDEELRELESIKKQFVREMKRFNDEGESQFLNSQPLNRFVFVFHDLFVCFLIQTYCDSLLYAMLAFFFCITDFVIGQTPLILCYLTIHTFQALRASKPSGAWRLQRGLQSCGRVGDA